MIENRICMRLVFIVLLSTIFKPLSAQITEGTYQSTANSFRPNYFLKIEKDSISILGWEANMGGDTIYYKATCKNEKSDQFTFTTFIFSYSKNDTSCFNKFKRDPLLNVETFLLFRYFLDIKVTGSLFTVLATKDAYDSRADKFEFIKLK